MKIPKLISSLFGKDNSKSIKPNNISDLKLSTRIILNEPNIYLSNRGARICVGMEPIKKDNDYETYISRKKYISKLSKSAHESVLEHSNLVAVISVELPQIKDDKNISLDILKMEEEILTHMSEMIAACRFLNIRVNMKDIYHPSNYEANFYIKSKDKYNKAKISFDTLNKKKFIHILLGGSIRGYLHLIRELNPNNKFIPAIRDIFYNGIEKEFAESVMDLFPKEDVENKWWYTYSTQTPLSYEGDEEMVYGDQLVDDKIEIKDPEYIADTKVDLVYNSNLKYLLTKLNSYGFCDKEFIYDMGIVSFVIHDISRSCANQIVRHRVGISQESQRYVTFKYDMKSGFIDPIKEIMENNVKNKYEQFTEEDIKRLEGNDDLFSIYNRLISNGIDKEDARAFLPMNVKTKLMITMTYRQLGHFLQLRSDIEKTSGAQYEIKTVANQMAKYLETKQFDFLKIFYKSSYQSGFGTDIKNLFIKYSQTNRSRIFSLINDNNIFIDDDVDEDLEIITEELPNKELKFDSEEELKNYMNNNVKYPK